MARKLTGWTWGTLGWFLASFVLPVPLWAQDGFVFPVLGLSQNDPTNNTVNPLGDGWGGNWVGWSNFSDLYGHLGQDYYRTTSCSGSADASVGKPVFSVAAGTVVRVVNNPKTTYGWEDNQDHGWGRVVVIRHTSASGFSTQSAMLTTSPNEANPTVVYTLYGHLKRDSILVQEGGVVTRGQHIADIGKGGVDVSWTCSHLHFEIKNETAYNSTTSPDSCCVSRYVPGVGVGYSGTNQYAPNRYLPGPFITNNGFGGALKVVGDWNGDGTDAVWTFSGGQWTIPGSDAGGQELQRAMGIPGDLPIVGDWNGDGHDDPGIFRASQNPSTFYLDINGDFKADWVLPLLSSYPQDVPVAGDWDGDGKSDVGAWDMNTRRFYLFKITSPSTFVDHTTFQMGNLGDIPIAGNWDGIGPTEVGVFRRGDPNVNTNNFYFRKNDDTRLSLTMLPGGMPNGWGDTGDIPIVGDWNHDGYDTIGLYRPSTQGMFFAEFPKLTASVPPKPAAPSNLRVAPFR